MNRTIRIISIIGILLACTMLVAFKSQETNTKYIRTNYVSGTHGKTYVIESLAELEEYYNANKEKHNLGHREKVYSDTTIGFADATKEYDEEFFKDHNIVLVLLTASSGSIRYKVENINLNDGVMEINITKKTPEIGTCDMAGWHIIIETDKQEIEEIKVMVDDKEITK